MSDRLKYLQAPTFSRPFLRVYPKSLSGRSVYLFLSFFLLSFPITCPSLPSFPAPFQPFSVSSHSQRSITRKTMSTTSEAQAKTLEKFIEAWQQWSAEGMLACFSPDVQQRSMPLSLGIPARKRQEVEAVLPKLVQVVDNYGVS